MRHQWKDLLNKPDVKVRQCKNCRLTWRAKKEGEYWKHQYITPHGDWKDKAGECGKQLTLKLY